MHTIDITTNIPINIMTNLVLLFFILTSLPNISLISKSNNLAISVRIAISGIFLPFSHLETA